MSMGFSVGTHCKRKYASNRDRHQALPSNISKLADDHAGEQSCDQ